MPRAGGFTAALQVLFAGTILAPFGLMILGAMSDNSHLLRGDIFHPNPANLAANLGAVVSQTNNSSFATALINSTILSALMVIFQLSSSVLAAYGFAYFDFKHKKFIYRALLCSYLVPPVATITPLFFVTAAIGLKETALGVVLPYLLFSPYALAALRIKFEGISKSFLDQAIIDGVGPWQLLLRIVIPISAPFIGIIGLVTFVSMWNSYLWPRLISGNGFPTVTVALGAMQGQYTANLNLVLTGALLALIPSISAFAITQKHLVAGFMEEIQE